MIILFLDIDGVFNISNPDVPATHIGGLVTWPLPMTIPLLKAIDQDKQITPIWMSHWGPISHAWNTYAGTSQWGIGYPLSPHDEAKAHYLYPDSDVDSKVLAIQYYLRLHPATRAIWLEDGFPTVPPRWAEQNNVQLIDTNKEPLHSLLLSDQANVVKGFMRRLELRK
ncbi:MAG: hypothetical protein PVS3B3_35240 [Ktedonobacteraceae bacterium]